KAIRKSEDDTGGRIPIIALSASVLEEEKNHYWQAGMDGFIGKPIDFTELFSRYPGLSRRMKVLLLMTWK
ncbi:hypothetical protein VU11_02575, partial [Desulfobulbus sp. US2]|nr:hypothetical protein [Desulfobulbus sp. US2]